MNRYKFIVPTLYFIIFFFFLSALFYIFYKQHLCDTCTFQEMNPSSYLMPILAYLSIGLAGITIGFTRKTASEKNALEFAKDWADLREHVQVLYMVRQKMLLPNRQLDRRKATAYMESLYSTPKPNGPATAAHDAGASPNPKEPEKTAEEATKQDVASTAPSTVSMRSAAVDILNAMESCANAVRYGIYDEDFIYNIYGSHFIEVYELTYGLIKARQFQQARLWVNFEWLAVKWTLRRNITGVISKESVDTSYIINQSLKALKDHNKTRPCTYQLRKFEAKLERRKFPM